MFNFTHLHQIDQQKGHKMAYRRYFDGSFPTHAHECADSNMVLQVIMTSSLYYMRTTYRNRKIFFPIKTVQILKETVPSSLPCLKFTH